MKSSIRIAGALLLALAAGAQAQNLSIATGGTGGVYYPLGGGFAAVLSKKVPGMQATAEVTGGSVANRQLIGTGKPYIAFTQADAA
ncbi:MAG: C4-dicarboxylate ABC transporter substrate-binding protein, partial [Betaproteobacteria bacterium]|nr:C4-dicarboxylate ABC transporter substrate-binding protein [Betaproteobacteria bacterium]